AGKELLDRQGPVQAPRPLFEHGRAEARGQRIDFRDTQASPRLRAGARGPREGRSPGAACPGGEGGMKAIAVFGRKGGSGKTLLSHFLSHGMSLLDFTTIMLQTDVRTARPPEIIDTRSYMLASTRGDGTDLTLIQKVIDKASALPNSVLVMDGGANRRNLDLALAPLADLVLVPTGYSAEDIAVAEQDYWELTGRLSEVGSSAEVYIVMNRWPGLTRKLNHIQQKQWVREFLARCDRQDNLFPYFVPDMPSLLDMAHGE